MFPLLTRFFGMLCLFGVVVVLTVLFLGLRNLPAILTNVRRLIRWVLRGSYRLYSAFLAPIRTRVYEQTGFDIFQPVIRTTCTVILSLGIGIILLLLFFQGVPTWILILLALHGIFVGLAWETILRSEDFQTGVNLE